MAFHEGHIDDTPDGPFDGATCLLTLHFLSQKERLPVLPPEDEVALVEQAGFGDIQLFYAAFTVKGWAARA